MLYTFIGSPIGELMVSAARNATATFITGVYIPGHDRRPGRDWIRADGEFDELRGQLGQYFAGERRDFDLSTAAPGTPFQHRVWDQLRRIDYGRTTSYGQVALAIGSPTASRAVGGANGRNPLSIIVPCHRVVGSNGKLPGHAAGPSAKSWLLQHERRHLGASADSPD